MVRVMQDAGVNVDAPRHVHTGRCSWTESFKTFAIQVFADMLDMVWDDSSKTSGSITFTDLVNMVLNMRGSNPATVKAGQVDEGQLGLDKSSAAVARMHFCKVI